MWVRTGRPQSMPETAWTHITPPGSWMRTRHGLRSQSARHAASVRPTAQAAVGKGHPTAERPQGLAQVQLMNIEQVAMRNKVLSVNPAAMRQHAHKHKAEAAAVATRQLLPLKGAARPPRCFANGTRWAIARLA